MTPAFLRTLAVLAVLFIAIMGAGGVYTLDTPRAELGGERFDARAAQGRLGRILGEERPHPIDSPAQDHVRARLLQEIVALGFAPEVRERFACRPQPRGPLVECGRVRNIIFSIGPERGPAILAVSHYDSVPAGPGASDDGIGFSVWLELARMLARESLQRRIVFLFSDGEEQALLGAYAFANTDALMDEVESLVNLEARGTRGPAIFFESNQPNADAVQAYSAVARPVANSVMADVYRLLPNSTDVTVLTRPGLDVINIALLDGLEDYHTPQDSLASQDLRSVQHMGDSVLAIMRRLAAGPDEDRGVEMAYTDIASRVFVSAPTWMAVAALWSSVLIAFVAFWRAGRDARWRTFAAPPIAVLLATALAFAADFLLRILRPGEEYAFAHPEPTRAWCVLLALLAAALSMMALRAGRSPQQLAGASVFWFALFGGLASLLASGVSILFALPAFAFAVAWLIALAWKPAEAIGGWASALLVLLVWAPILFLVELALGWEMPFAFAALAALALLPWFGIVAQAQGEARWRGVAGVVGAATLVAMGASAIMPAATEARPRPMNLSYFVNASENEAYVLAGSAERALPNALRGAFEPRSILPGDAVETWAAPAAVESIPAPRLEDVSVALENGQRVVRGRLAMNGAYRTTLRMPATEAPQRVLMNGVSSEFADAGIEGEDFINVACQGRTCDGVAVEIVLGDGQGDEDWYVIGQTPGLQVAAAEALRARRPVNTTPIQFGDTAIALTRFRPGG